MQLRIAAKSTDEENFDKMKAAYDACLDEGKIKSIGAEPLLQIWKEIKDVFPAATSASDSHAIKDTILFLAKYGVTALVASGTGADDTDPDTVVVSVGAPWSFGLPSKERYEDDKLVEKYRDVVVEVLGALTKDQKKEVFAGIVDLEKKLAGASPSEEEREDVTVGFIAKQLIIFSTDILTEILQPDANRRSQCYSARDRA